MLHKVKASLQKHFVPPNLHRELDAPPGVVRPKVWLEVVKGEESYDSRRIDIELFSDIVPKTAENFRQLCTGECGRSYERATFHRVVPDFTIQGGDIINGDGTGTWSIYGGPFPDENFSIPHDAKGLVSMANSGPNTNGCQFFITLAPADFLNGKHVVFGRVVGGWDIVKKIAAVKTVGERPTEVIGIVACGGDGPATGQTAHRASDSTLAAGVAPPRQQQQGQQAQGEQVAGQQQVAGQPGGAVGDVQGQPAQQAPAAQGLQEQPAPQLGQSAQATQATQAAQEAQTAQPGLAERFPDPPGQAQPEARLA